MDAATVLLGSYAIGVVPTAPTSMAAEEAPERITETSKPGRTGVSDTSTGKVVVNRSMSLDGFIAGPGHTMDWGAGRPLADFVAPDDLQEIAAATGSTWNRSVAHGRET